MPLLKSQKHDLAGDYVKLIDSAVNVVVVQYSNLSVNDVNDLRQGLAEASWKIKVVKKRVFLKGVDSLDWAFDWLDLSQVPWSVALILSDNEESPFAPLKVVSGLVKWRKKKKKESDISYVGAWIDGARNDSAYIAELAALPSKEELIWKFLFMLNHPVSSFARVLKAIWEKGE